MTGKVARRQPIALDEFSFLHDNATALPKVTLPAPSTMHFWRGSGYADPGIYDSPRDFFRDLAVIYRAEIADLAAALMALKLSRLARKVLFYCKSTHAERARDIRRESSWRSAIPSMIFAVIDNPVRTFKVRLLRNRNGKTIYWPSACLGVAQKSFHKYSEFGRCIDEPLQERDCKATEHREFVRWR